MDNFQTVIFLIRHGQTDRAYSPDQDTDGERLLTEEGIVQLKKVGEYLKSFAPVKIFASPTKRTLQSAQIIAQQVGDIEIEKSDRLFEVYSNERYDEAFKDGSKFLKQLAMQYSGQHVICVSHQDIIEQFVRGLGASADEAQFPCKMSQGYRVVFANDKFVEITKINPANAV